MASRPGGLTGSGVILGTPGYMAPEQIRGEPVDARADLFAVGAVLHEMLAGRRLFDGPTVRERLVATLSGSVPPPSGPGLPEGLAAVVARALSRDPANRWSSAGEFLAELRRGGPREAATHPVQTLAILDFDGSVDEPDTLRIGGDLADNLAVALGRVAGLRVVPRSEVLAAREASGESAAAPKPAEVARRLGAGMVLSGAFRMAGPSLRVRARLIEVATGRVVWEEALDGDVSRFAAVPGRVTAAVAAILGLTLPGPRAWALPASRVEAYRNTALGQKLWWDRFEKGSIEEACALLERAVALAPDFGLALASLAEVYAFRANIADDPQIAEQAIAYARRAIEADPLLAKAHIWLGYALQLQGRQLEAYRAFLAAGQLDPEDPMVPYFAVGPLLPAIGRREALVLHEALTGEPCDGDPHRWRRGLALEHIRRAIALGPEHAWIWMSAGTVHLDLGRPDEARRCFEEAIALESTSIPPLAGVAVLLGECLRRSGELAEASVCCLAGLVSLARSSARNSGHPLCC